MLCALHPSCDVILDNARITVRTRPTRITVRTRPTPTMYPEEKDVITSKESRADNWIGMEKWWNVTDRRETCPSATVSATTLQETGVRLNSVLSADSSAPNHLSTDHHAMAFVICWRFKTSQYRVFRDVSKNGSNAITRNIGRHLANGTALHARIVQSSCCLLMRYNDREM